MSGYSSSEKSRNKTLTMTMYRRIILCSIFSNLVFQCARAHSITSDQFICAPGILTWGVTSPKGDIMLEAGETLEINCTLDRGHIKVNGRSSKDIQFGVGKHEIPDNLLEKTIIDESTAMLRIKSMNVSTPVVSCFLPNPFTSVCQNQVDVGYPPLPVENLKCLARDWKSLNCTWNKPRNNIFTTYNIAHIDRKYVLDCPNKILLNKTTESCVWNGKTEPHYRPNLRNITIVMTGVNKLTPEGIQWEYEFHNWEIVIPSKAERLVVNAKSAHEINVAWSFPNFEHFVPGLDHRVTICLLDPIGDCSVIEFKSNRVGNLTRVFTLPYAFTKYQVEIKMKSQLANDTLEFWSPPTIHPSIQTLSKQPDFPPRTGIGTFEVFNKYQLRDITIYWENIPVFRQNGSNFHIKFTVFEDNIQRSYIRPEFKEKKNFALFRNLSLNSFRYEISSVNSEGESPEKAIVFIEKTSEAPKEPESVSKVDYTNGTYEISWRHPTHSHSEITSYTVYRCRGTKVQCDELEDWVDVKPWETHYIFHGLDTTVGAHVFAVSSNTNYTSSGMVVATCELIHNKILGKLKDVSAIDSSATAVEIKWGLDCSFKPGLVQGFRIRYCEVKVNDACTNSSQQKDIEVSGETTSFRLESLEPFSTYIVWVSMVTSAGESQTSDPVRVTTLETAPSDPPQVKTIITTNTTATLGITAPIKANGKIQKYEIFYESVNMAGGEKKGFNTVEAETLERGDDNMYNYNLTQLETNSNYTVHVVACTISCSNISDPVFVQTKFGYTKFTESPSLTYDNGKLLVQWTLPKHSGGPMGYFQLLVQKNGEEVEPRKIPYERERKIYFHAVDLKCEANTNITARTRVINIVDSVELFGDWSPEGSFNCYGSEAWFLWILIVIASLICFVMLTFVSIKCWRKIKIMHALDVIAPPGMEQLQLNGFSERHGKRIRQNSGGDTHPFGKENLICQSSGFHSTHNGEDCKDCMSSDSKENENEKGNEDVSLELDLNSKNDSLGGEFLALENDKCPIWLWQSPMMIPGNEDGVEELKFPLNNNTNPHSEPCLPGHGPHSDVLLDKRISPSPSNPLISDCSPSNSGDEEDDLHYQTLHFEEEDEESPSQCNGDCHYDPPPPLPKANCGPLQNHLVNPNQDLRLEPNKSGNDYANDSNLRNLSNGSLTNQRVPEATLNSAYVKWTSLKTDPIIGIPINGKAPYCQVGILLEQ